MKIRAIVKESSREAVAGVSLDEQLGTLRTAIDEGDASGVAKGDVFARVREALNLPEKPR